MNVELHGLHSERREDVGWFSESLERRMDLFWYGEAGRPMLWFPSFHGRHYDLEGFGMIAVVEELIDNRLLQVVCVDTVDAESFGADALPPAERIARHDAYDRYLAAEVVPWFQEEAGLDRRIGALGVSCGAYHAVNFGFRHPDLVDKVVGISGVYTMDGFLDDYADETVYLHCPLAYVANMDQEWVARLTTLDIAIVSGEEDYLVDESRAMITVLERQGIPHRGHVWRHPYGHDWQWWQRQLLHYVP